MINFSDDDPDNILARVAAQGVTPLSPDDTDSNGRVVWILVRMARRSSCGSPRRA